MFDEADWLNGLSTRLLMKKTLEFSVKLKPLKIRQCINEVFVIFALLPAMKLLKRHLRNCALLIAP